MNRLVARLFLFGMCIAPTWAACSPMALPQESPSVRWIDPSGSFSLQLTELGWEARETQYFGPQRRRGMITNVMPQDDRSLIMFCSVEQRPIPFSSGASQNDVNEAMREFAPHVALEERSVGFGAVESRREDLRNGVLVFTWRTMMPEQRPALRYVDRAFALRRPYGAELVSLGCVLMTNLDDPDPTTAEVSELEALLNSLRIESTEHP